MELHEELLDQAKHLWIRFGQTSHQADLRRAISAAYYSLFQFIIAQCCRCFIGDDPSSEPLRSVMARAFVHEEMASASKPFMAGSLPENIRPLFVTIPPELKKIAGAFVQIQDQRYAADYDLSRSFGPQDVELALNQVETAIQVWPKIANHPTTHLYLLLLVAGKPIRSRKFGLVETP